MPATMSEPSRLGHHVTVAEAAVILAVSVNRVRQMIRDGILQAEKIRRNTGTAYVIDLDAAPKSVLSSIREDRQSRDAVRSAEQAPAQAMAQIITALTDKITEQAEIIGELRAELAAVRSGAEGRSVG
jgi:excisionase family DNA binding protein